MIKLPSDLTSHGKYMGNAYGESPLIILSTGEDLNKTLVNKLFHSIPSLKIYNCYGPSEAGFGLTLCPIMRDDAFCGIFKSSHGVFSRRLALVKIEEGKAAEFITESGMEGEICFQNEEGEFIGYLNAKDLTLKKQIKITGESWYTTGDLASWSVGNKVLQFRERKGMVKINGRKIDFDPIKTKLQEHPGIEQFGVTATLKDPLWILVAYTPKEGISLTSEEVLQYLSKGLYDNTAIHVMPAYEEFPQNANRKFYETKVREDFEASLRGYGKDYRKALMAYIRWFLKEDISDKDLLESNFERLGFNSKSYMQFRTSLYHHPAFQPWPNIPEVDTNDCHAKPAEFLVSTVEEALRLQDNLEMMGDEKSGVLVFGDCDKEYAEDLLEKNNTPISMAIVKKYLTNEIFWRTLKLKKSKPPYLVLVDMSDEKLKLHKAKNTGWGKNGRYMENNLEKLLDRLAEYKKEEERIRCFQKLDQLQERYRNWFDLSGEELLERVGPKIIEKNHHYIFGKQFVITGLAGSGKTTVLKQVCLEILKENPYTPFYIVDKMTFDSDPVVASLRREGFTSEQIELLKNEELHIVMDDVDIVKTPFDDLVLPKELSNIWKNSKFLVTQRSYNDGIKVEVGKEENLQYFKNYQRYSWYKNKLLSTVEPITFNKLEKSGYLSLDAVKALTSLCENVVCEEYTDSDNTFINPRLYSWIREYYTEQPLGSMGKLLRYLAGRWLTTESRRYIDVSPELSDGNYHHVIKYAKKLYEELAKNPSGCQVKRYDCHNENMDYNSREILKKVFQKIEIDNIFDHTIKWHYYSFNCLPVYFDNDGLIHVISRGLLREIAHYEKNEELISTLTATLDVEFLSTAPEAFHLYNSQGNNIPIFFLAPLVGRDILQNNRLKVYFSSHPIYSLQHPGYIHPDYIRFNLKDQVRYYAGLINTLYPEGNIILLGYSFGGLLATLIAEELENLYQRNIIYTGNVDARCPRLWHDMDEKSFQAMLAARLQWIGEALYPLLGQLEDFKQEMKDLKNSDCKYSLLGKKEGILALKAFLKTILNKQRERLIRLSKNGKNEFEERSRMIFVALENLSSLYEEEVKTIQRLHKSCYLYTSTDDHPYYTKVSSECLGWKGLSDHRVNSIRGSNHFTLIKDPYIGVLCEQIEKHSSILVNQQAIKLRELAIKKHWGHLKAEKPEDYYLEPTLENKQVLGGLDKNLDDFLINDKKLFVIYGESGAGKSYFLRHYFGEEREIFLQKAQLPIYLRIQNDFESDVIDALEDVGFGVINLQEFLKSQALLIIIDGIDEMPWIEGYFKHPLFSDANIKIVVACLCDEYNKNQLSALISQEFLSNIHMEEITLLSITEFDIEIYFKKFEEKHSGFYKAKAFKTLQNPDVKSLMETPLSLFLFCSSFTEMLNGNILGVYHIGLYYKELAANKLKSTKELNLSTLDFDGVTFDNCTALAVTVFFEKSKILSKSLTQDFLSELAIKKSPIRLRRGGVKFSHMRYVEYYVTQAILYEMATKKRDGLLSKYDITACDNLLKIISVEIANPKSDNFAINFSISPELNKVERRNLKKICENLKYNFNDNINEDIFPLETLEKKSMPSLFEDSFIETSSELVYGEPSQMYSDRGMHRVGNRLVLYNNRLIHELAENAGTYIRKDFHYYYTFTGIIELKKDYYQYTFTIRKYFLLKNEMQIEKTYSIKNPLPVYDFPLEMYFSNPVPVYDFPHEVYFEEGFIVLTSTKIGVLCLNEQLEIQLWLQPEDVFKIIGKNNFDFKIKSCRKSFGLVIENNRLCDNSFEVIYIRFSDDSGRDESLMSLKFEELAFPKKAGLLSVNEVRQVKSTGIIKNGLYLWFNKNELKYFKLHEFDEELLSTLILPSQRKIANYHGHLDFKIRLSFGGEFSVFYNSHYIGFRIAEAGDLIEFSHTPLNFIIKKVDVIGRNLILAYETIEGVKESIFSLYGLVFNYLNWEMSFSKNHLNQQKFSAILAPVVYFPDKRCYGKHSKKLYWASCYHFLKLSILQSQLLQVAKINKNSISDATMKINEEIAKIIGYMRDPDLSHVMSISETARVFSKDPGKSFRLLNEKNRRYLKPIYAEIQQLDNPPKNFIQKKIKPYVDDLKNKLVPKFSKIYGKEFQDFYENATKWEKKSRRQKSSSFEETTDSPKNLLKVKLTEYQLKKIRNKTEKAEDPFYEKILRDADFYDDPISADEVLSQLYSDKKLMRFGRKLVLLDDRKIIHVFLKDVTTHIADDLYHYYTFSESIKKIGIEYRYTLSIRKYFLSTNELLLQRSYRTFHTTPVSSSPVEVDHTSRYLAVVSERLGVLYLNTQLETLGWFKPQHIYKITGGNHYEFEIIPGSQYNIIRIFNPHLHYGVLLTMEVSLPKNVNVPLMEVYEIDFPSAINPLSLEEFRAISSQGLIKNGSCSYKRHAELYDYGVPKFAEFKSWEFENDFYEFFLVNKKLIDVSIFSESSLNFHFAPFGSLMVLYNSYCLFIQPYENSCGKNIFSYTLLNARILTVQAKDKDSLSITLDTSEGCLDAVFSFSDLERGYLNWEMLVADPMCTDENKGVYLMPVVYSLRPRYHLPLPEKLFLADCYSFLMLSALQHQLHYEITNLKPGDLTSEHRIQLIMDEIRLHKTFMLDKDFFELKRYLSRRQACMNWTYSTPCDWSNYYVDGQFLAYINSVIPELEARLPDVYGKDFEAFYEKALKWIENKNLLSFDDLKVSIPENLLKAKLESHRINNVRKQWNACYKDYKQHPKHYTFDAGIQESKACFYENTISSTEAATNTGFFARRRSNSLSSTPSIATHQRRASFG